MITETCGYQGHVCGDRVQFISRYRCENDYCVSGRRVSITDDGQVRRALHGDIERIRLFELDRYAEYLRWRSDNRRLFEDSGIPIAAFEFPARLAEAL